LIRPGVGATAAYILFLTWQEFMFALTFITSQDKRTLPVGIFDFVGQYETNWGNLMAASVLICIPVFILFHLYKSNWLVGSLKAQQKDKVVFSMRGIFPKRFQYLIFFPSKEHQCLMGEK
jgi:ABC-type glycerol-3-phosphate transport system permease component